MRTFATVEIKKINGMAETISCLSKFFTQPFIMDPELDFIPQSPFHAGVGISQGNIMWAEVFGSDRGLLCWQHTTFTPPLPCCLLKPRHGNQVSTLQTVSKPWESME